VSWLTDGGSKQQCCCFQRRRERFFLFPSPLFFVLSFSVSFTSGCLFVLVVLLFNKISLPGFKLPLNLSFPLSIKLLSFRSLSLLSSVLSFLSFPLLFLCLSSLFFALFSFSLCVFLFCSPPLSVGIECSIYRAKGSGGRPYCRPIAVREERRQPALPRRQARQPMGVGLQSMYLLIFHHEGACVGLWVLGRSMRGERGRKN